MLLALFFCDSPSILDPRLTNPRLVPLRGINIRFWCIPCGQSSTDACVGECDQVRKCVRGSESASGGVPKNNGTLIIKAIPNLGDSTATKKRSRARRRNTRRGERRRSEERDYHRSTAAATDVYVETCSSRPTERRGRSPPSRPVIRRERNHAASHRTVSTQRCLSDTTTRGRRR